MKRYKKKEILQTMSTLIRTNDQIVTFAKSNPKGVTDVLITCQESAVLLGTYFESLGPQYGHFVGILEEYCENIFRVNESITDEILCHKLSKKIRKQLDQLYQGVIRELPQDRKEVVFLPYKACMWDSLESVWKKAEADENTDAYVIPIPYYDRNSKGAFCKEHYEGGQYPGYVPITDYRKYNFEERRPDEIYIHNPYDNCNIVTSIHPYFYSENLKKYTEKLIYIPYFILSEIDPENTQALEGMKQFCLVPGVFHSDKIIVQSEKMKKVYINILAKETGGTKDARKYWENKIDGSGSPKLEKLANTSKSDIEIPEEWLRVIKKTDNTQKKIILYNNSITSLLKHNESMIRKMQAVFELFKDNRDRVALLWRPHPLIESTLISMRPQLWEAYKEIRDKYLAEGWGIYDDTADIDRAIVISDAYYGDPSSVVQMYQQTRKPVMLLQTLLGLQRNEKYYNNVISAHDVAITNGKLYLSALNWNGLYSCNILGESVELLGNFPNERMNAQHLHGASLYKDGKVYFAPMSGTCIAVYDIEKSKVNSIKLKENLGCTKSKYYGILSQGKSIYFIPSRADYIISLDTDTMETEYHGEWTFGLNKTKNSDIPQIKNGTFIRNSSLYLPYGRENILIKISLQNFSTEYLRIGKEPEGFVDASYDALEDIVWLLRNGKEGIVRYDFTKNISEEYSYQKVKKQLTYPFINMIDMGDRIYIVSYQSEYSLIFIKDTRTFERICLENKAEDCERQWGAKHYTAKKLTDDIFLVMNTGDYSMFEVDSCGGICRSFVLEDKLRTIRTAYSRSDKLVRENENVGLHDYLEYVCRLS